MGEIAAEGMAHVVFPGLWATGDDLQIRNNQKSDLRMKEEGLLRGKHKNRRIVATRGLLL